MPLSAWLTSLGNTILHVVAVGTDKEMSWIHAPRNIASVTNEEALGNGSVMHLVAVPMCGVAKSFPVASAAF